MNSFRSGNRQQQLQAYANMHKRPIVKGQYPQHSQNIQRKQSSIASSSVYDPDETSRNIKISIKQAITLITLRLGRLEVMANENKMGDKVLSGESGVDKEFLMSIVSRLDNMEKTLHNLRVDFEKNRQVVSTLNEEIEAINIQEEPIILEMTKKINDISSFIENFQKDVWDLENESKTPNETTEIETSTPLIENETTSEPTSETNLELPESVSETSEVSPEVSPENEVLPPALVYNPNVIETYVEPKKKRGKKVSI